ncbi:MAG: phytanoyl-CoA dioxygenase family protein [Caldilineaceae bacterium]|nr:phytanoyl-CoA dioxygenase family protein [Caldilineaceae bacterium]
MNKSASTMESYVREGKRMAYELGNRGPIRFNADGTLHQEIIDAYWRCGFYVLEGALADEELNDLRVDMENGLERAPYTKDATVDAQGRPALGVDLTRPSFRFAKPLSDPYGGTELVSGRHPAKMSEPAPPSDAPDYVINSIGSPLQIMDSCLRLYGHPQLLAIAAAINGPDFVPFTESVIVKRAGLGPSVAWHHDGTTHWDSPDWDEGTHGFNFMAQLYGSTAENGVWLLPGSHKLGKMDIKAMVEENGSDRLPGAAPMICEPGDVCMSNRQALHASFANTSPQKRITINFGFHRLQAVLNTRTKHGGTEVVYDAERVVERSRIIALAIDARQQRFPNESRYVYKPLAGQEDANRWNDDTRVSLLRNYNLKDLSL